MALMPSCFAQDMSLQDAINIALKNSFDIQIAKNNQQISTINNNIGIAGGLPLVTGSITDNEQVSNINQEYSNPANNTKRDNAASNTLSAGVTGSILLYNGLRVVATKHQLEVLEQIDKQKLTSAVQDIISSVMLKYYDIVRQKSYWQTLQQSIVVSKQKLDIIELQRKVGMANDADLWQAQLDLNGQIQASKSQELIIEQDKTDLLTFLTLNPDSVIDIKDTITVDKNVTLDSVLAQLQNNADVRAADLQIQANRWIEKETAAQRYPSIRLNAGYNFGRTQNASGFSLLNQSYGPFVGVSIGIPIYNGSIYKREEEVAKINTQNAALQKDILLRDYKSDAVKTWQAYTNTLEQLETETQNNKLSAQLLDLIIKKFQLKQATIIDVKQAQQSFEESGYRLVNLSYAAKSSEIELKRLLNQLSF
ncbi:TolC family protein [Ferruginibacter albus]|nr:TolC family protein [Ferruginibacter albus]